MKIDQNYQLELLNQMKAAFPESLDLQAPEKNLTDTDFQKLHANLEYMQQKGWIEYQIIHDLSSGSPALKTLKITADGIDYIDKYKPPFNIKNLI